MVKLLPIVAVSTLLFGAGPAFPQEPGAAPAPAPQAEPKEGAESLIQKLGDESYKERLQAEQKLRALGKDALPALRAAAEKSGDPEVGWRVRRLIRQIERGEAAGLRDRKAPAPEGTEPPARGPGGWRALPGFEDMESRFDELFRSLERDFGMDIPRRRFFQDDFFRDLEQQMEDVRKQTEELRAGVGPGPMAQGRSMSMQVGPDGVRVEVKQKNDKGEEESKVYEAPDLETFQQKYPGVLDQQGLGGGIRLFMGRPQRVWGTVPRSWPAEPEEQALPAPPADRRLGVIVRPEVPQDLRDWLELPEGTGLLVEQVQDDSLAARLGLRAGDIVLKIGAKAIGSTGDVQAALGAIEAGQQVEVQVNRKGKELTLRAEKPAAPKTEPGGKLAPREGGGVLR